MITAPSRPGTMRAFKRLYEEIERLDTATRWAMARKESGRPELAELDRAVGWLMMRPDDQELMRFAIALFDAVKRMDPVARSVFVKTVFRPEADMQQLQPTYDALAELVALIDKRTGDG